jgi:predicted phage terminase large subunit-like protein
MRTRGAMAATETWLSRRPAEDQARIVGGMTPRMPKGIVPVLPNAKQQALLILDDLEVFYGGAAGPGKSWGLLMAALQYIDVPGYSALILRQTFADLSLPGALLDVAHDWLDPIKAVKHHPGTHTFKMAGGGQLAFGYCRNVKEVQRYRGAAFQFIGLDESSLFPERVYRFMFSRCRRPAVPCARCGEQLEKRDGVWVHAPKVNLEDLDRIPEPLITDCDPLPNDLEVKRYGAAADGTTIFDIPPRMRAASNPGGPGHAWNKARFVTRETRNPGAVYVPAKMTDNPNLDVAAYLKALREQFPTDFQRFAAGDWEVHDPGQWFFSEQFPIVMDPWPPSRDIVRVRRWDLAGSSVDEGGNPDWTVGALVAYQKSTGRMQIQDIVRARVGPGAVEKLLHETAENDGVEIPHIVEQEPGASGKILVASLARGAFAGYSCRGVPSSGAKEARIRVLIPMADDKKIELVSGAWNRAFVLEAESWRPEDPDAADVHDDQLDTVSAAAGDLTGRGRSKIR